MTDQLPPDQPQYPGQFPPQQPPNSGQYPGQQPPWQPGPPQPGPGQSQPWGGQSQQPWGGQQQPWPQQTWPGGQQPPPGGPPPRKSHVLRNILILAIPVVIVILVIAGAIGAATSGHKTGSTTPNPPPTTAPVAVTLTLTATEQKFVSDINGDRVITATAGSTSLLAIGHGLCKVLKDGAGDSTALQLLRAKMINASAKEFLKVTERDLCPSAVPKVIATFTGSGIENTAKFYISGSGNWVLKWSYDCSSLGMSGNFIVDEDGGNDFNGANVNELSAGGRGRTHVYSDAGSHYLSVNSECSWRVQVVQ